MAENTQLMKDVKYGITQSQVDYLVGQLDEKEKAGLRFPPNYSARNAMQSAYLMLREAEDKDGKPLLSACTQDSVAQALMQMATQGLNPVKKQCYFVAYGNKCRLVPSYFGTLAVLNRVKNLKRQPVANVVRKGDVFEYGYDLDTLEMRIRNHETKLENIDAPIVAAYAVIATDRETVTEIMSMAQIENAWAQGQAWQQAKKKGYESKTHKAFAEEMAKKTVLNRAAKRLINATDDSSIMGDEAIQAFNDADEPADVVAEQAAEEVAEGANSVPFQPENQAQSRAIAAVETSDEEEMPEFMKG